MSSAQVIRCQMMVLISGGRNDDVVGVAVIKLLIGRNSIGLQILLLPQPCTKSTPRYVTPGGVKRQGKKRTPVRQFFLLKKIDGL